MGFGAAGVGMTIGLIQYTLGRKHLGRRRPLPRGSGIAPRRPRNKGDKRFSGARSPPRVIVLGGLAMYTGMLPITPTQLADAAGYFLLGLTVAFFGWLFLSPGWTPRERKQLYVVGVLFLAAALFWSEFEQAGSTLNLFADRDTQNSVFGWEFPSSYYQSLNSLFLIALAPVFAWFWLRLGRAHREPSSPAKFGIRPRCSSAPASRCWRSARSSPSRA